MDEIFGAADYSHVEDVGLAAKHAKEEEKDATMEDVHHTTKV